MYGRDVERLESRVREVLEVDGHEHLGVPAHGSTRTSMAVLPRPHSSRISSSGRVTGTSGSAPGPTFLQTRPHQVPKVGTNRARPTTLPRVWNSVSAGLAVSGTSIVGMSSAVTTMK